MTQDNIGAKQKAFSRAKTDLQKLGFIEVMDNNYTIDHGKLNQRALNIVSEFEPDPFTKLTLTPEPGSRTGQDI